MENKTRASTYENKSSSSANPPFGCFGAAGGDVEGAASTNAGASASGLDSESLKLSTSRGLGAIIKLLASSATPSAMPSLLSASSTASSTVASLSAALESAASVSASSGASPLSGTRGKLLGTTQS